MLNKIKSFIDKLNSYGIPLPLLRIDGKATLTGTMVVISFLTAFIGQAGKISKFLGDLDLSQANYLLGICLAAYLGRKFQGDSTKKTVTIEDKQQ